MILNVNIGGCVIVGKFVPFSNLAPNEQKSKQKLQTSQNSAEFRQGKNLKEKNIKVQVFAKVTGQYELIDYTKTSTQNSSKWLGETRKKINLCNKTAADQIGQRM